MKKLLIVIVFFSCFLQLDAAKVATFPQVANPKHLIVDNGQIIISDFPYIYIYSLDDLSLKKRIGGQGEGPGDFYIPQGNMNLKERGLVISVSPGYIAASSVGRVSFFKRNGDFHKLSRSKYNLLNAKFMFFSGKLLGFMPRAGGKMTVSLFDPDLVKQKKIMEYDYWLNWPTFEMTDMFDRASDTLLVAAADNKIFLTRGDSPRLSIDAFDLDGNKLFTIERNIENVKISEEFIVRCREHFQAKFRIKSDHPEIKKIIETLPEVFPAVRAMCAADHKLYVVTFKEAAGQTLVLVFSTKGDFLEEISLPVKEKDPEKLFPFSVNKNKFYQIVESEKNEEWELFVTPINQ
jgi:hypothetical protein